MTPDPTLFDIASIPPALKRPKAPFPKDSLTQARNFHGWTLEKLELFDLYLKAYRRVAGSGSFIDAFAGDGSASVNGVISRGSTRIALDSKAFKFCRFYEIEQANVDKLNLVMQDYTELVRDRTEVVHGDTNVKLVRDLEAGVIDRDKPCFALLDPNSTQLSWSTIEALARYKTYDPGPRIDHPRQCKVEMWILFNTHQALMRLVPKDLPSNFESSSGAVTLDRVMGGRGAWIDLLNGTFTYGKLLRRYVERLQGLEYQLVRCCQIHDPATGRPQYYMVHASDHPTAHSLMFWAQKAQRTAAGRTPSLFSEGQVK